MNEEASAAMLFTAHDALAAELQLSSRIGLFSVILALVMNLSVLFINSIPAGISPAYIGGMFFAILIVVRFWSKLRR